MQGKILYPAISIGSRSNQSVSINLGLQKFRFDLDKYVQEEHLYRIYTDIKDYPAYHGCKLREQYKKFDDYHADFHQMVKQYLIEEGCTETLAAMYGGDVGKLINKYCHTNV